MLIKNSHRNLSVLILIFALSCAPLFAADGRGRHRRKSKENKTKNKQLAKSDSEEKSGSRADSSKPERRRRKSKMRKEARVRRPEAGHKAGRRTKRYERKRIVVTPDSHIRTNVKKTLPVVRRRPSRRVSLIKINDKRKSEGRHRFRQRHRRKNFRRVIYRNRPRLPKRRHRYEHIYRDHRARLRHRIIWPKFRFVVSYRSNSGLTFGFCYPYHHRKYVFVSLGGDWPMHYRYRRYYWYGYHPNYWYGCNPIARQIKGDTYNYYTYNYYGAEGTGSVDDIASVDAGEVSIQQPKEEPAAETLADKRFEQAANAFEAGDYETAAEAFAEAIELEGDDIVLPFAYAQALFADGRYSQAAEALRLALASVPPETQGIFYPRGLYADDEKLFEQIDTLDEKAGTYSFDGDLQLLLGYHLLGVGLTDEALEPLQQARRDPQNATAAEILLELLEKIKTDTESK